MSLPALRDLLNQHFNDAELRQLTFDLGIQYENLPGEKTRIGKALALVEYCLRHNRLPDLTTHCQQLRPKATWPDGPALTAEWQTVQQGIAAQEKLQGLIAAEQLTAVLTALKQKELEILAQLLGQTGDPDLPPSAYAWEKHYLRTLLGYCDPLDVAAVDEFFTIDRESDIVRVTDVFTSLYLAHGQQPIRRLPRQSVKEAILRPRQPDQEMRGEREEGEPVTAVAAIAALPRLVILGYPGGGKSTLVNYLAAQLARRRLGQENVALPGWPDEAAPLPVRIILRHFAAALPGKIPPGKKGGLVWDYLEKTLLPQWGCQEALVGLKHLLTEEGGLILFDGLDEVHESDEESRRSLIKEAIVDFAAPLTHCKVVVTCREYAYKRGDAWRLPEADFPIVDLALFAPEQIEQFTLTWYQLTGPLKGWDSDRCQREAQRLFAASQQWPHLRELAQYPLLLTLMAQVHGRDGTLPEDRADLYERAVNLLLAHWENRIERDVNGERRIEPGLIAQLGVRTETLKGALAHVAFQAHERQEQATDRHERAADITRDMLWEELQTVLGSYDRAKQVTDYVQFRAGLLQARDRFTYTFPHRTFQEYLAALHIWKEANPGEKLADYVRRDLTWWREVFLLAAGQQKGTPKNVAELVEWLFPQAVRDSITPAQTELATLAGQALAETDFLRHARPQEPDYRFTVTAQRMKGWLLAAMQAEKQVEVTDRAAAGRALGRLYWPDGRLLDDRPGVGVLLREGVKLPDIAWGGEVPAGTYTIGGDKQAYRSFDKHQVLIKHPYRLSRYPITYAQFQCFVEAADSGDGRWWANMPEIAEAYAEKYPVREIAEQRFPYANHPREMVSWYQAVAFCRWLSDKVGQTVQLPHEYEWEVAARYPDGRAYPWSNDFDQEKANTNESRLNSITAVGLYPSGRNEALNLYDLSGNVWEWCRNKYQNPDDDVVDGSRVARVLRGGSWLFDQDLARAAFRHYVIPVSRVDSYGFRVVVVRRPPSHIDL
jgi:formylglycine-generating enzyme required for sulfatase activity